MTVSVSTFGKDHWSLLAYVECLCVDGKGGIGSIDPRRMRDKNTRTTVGAWKPSYSTRLAGFFDFADRVDTDKAIAAGVQLPNHDDWDCLDDLEEVGFVEVLSSANGFVVMTPTGATAAARLRAHKAAGGVFARFTLDTEADKQPEPTTA